MSSLDNRRFLMMRRRGLGKVRMVDDLRALVATKPVLVVIDVEMNIK